MTEATFKVLPEPESAPVPSKLMPKSSFTTEDTHETTTPFYRADDGSVSAGLWECAPCKVEIDAYPVNEMMTIISGSVTITNGDGVAETFGPGEVVFATKGARMTWHVTERLKKYFMISV